MSRIESMSTRRKFILFALMAVGQFMALRDSYDQIVEVSSANKERWATDVEAHA